MTSLDQMTAIKRSVMASDRWQPALLRNQKRDMRVGVCVIGAEYRTDHLSLENSKPCVTNREPIAKSLRYSGQNAGAPENRHFTSADQHGFKISPSSHYVPKF